MSAPTEPTARSYVWAETGDVTEPSAGEQQSGYTTGKPSRRKTNWMMHWLDNAIQWTLTKLASTVTTSVTPSGDGITLGKATKISLGGASLFLVSLSGDGTHYTGGFSIAEAIWSLLPGSYTFSSVESSSGADQGGVSLTYVAHGINFGVTGISQGATWNLYLAIFTVP